MHAPLDIDEFRDAIGRDEGMERLLLGLFLETLDRGVDSLAEDMPAQGWEEQLHLIKGAALNARAHRLLHLLEQGTACAHSNAQERADFLKTLQKEQAELHAFIAPRLLD